jgi:putative chitinase
MTFPSDAAVEAALRALSAADPAGWAPVIAAACRKHGIDTPQRVAAFLANVFHETGGLRSIVENLNYANSALVGVFGATRGGEAARRGLGRPAGSKVALTEAQQQALANCVYGGAWGLKNLGNTQENDGWFFRGQGLIQITGRANHTRFAKLIGVDVVQLQKLLATRDGAADSAAAFWAKAGVNACVDCGDIAGARRLVNGGVLGLDEVREHFAKANSVLLKVAA